MLWWIYNHHIAAQLCSKDLLVPYGNLLALDDQGLQQLFGPFLELHSHQRPSRDQARELISSLLKPEYNRAEDALSTDSRARIHPMLLEICDLAYNNIVNSGDLLVSFQEQFNVLPRAVLECSARDRLLPESETTLLSARLYSLKSEMQNLASSLSQRERDLDLLHNNLSALESSRSWKITAPLRAFGDFFRTLSS